MQLLPIEMLCCFCACCKLALANNANNSGKFVLSFQVLKEMEYTISHDASYISHLWRHTSLRWPMLMTDAEFWNSIVITFSFMRADPPFLSGVAKTSQQEATIGDIFLFFHLLMKLYRLN